MRKPDGHWRWIALSALALINLVNYIDRYIFSALLPAICLDLNLSDAQAGYLGSAFILAYVVASPLFGYLGDRFSRPRLMASGIALWSAATAFSGIATHFWSQLVTRVTVGLGESAYTVIAPSTLSDFFPRDQRGKIFALYGAAIPVGSALGYILGGQLEPIFGWQKVFFIVGIPGVLLAGLLFLIPDPVRGSSDQASDLAANGVRVDLGGSWWQRARDCLRELQLNGGYVCTVLGYAAYTFVVGGMAFWMPTFIVRYFHVSLKDGNTYFGAVTVLGGFIGTLLGGVVSDRIERSTGNGYLKVATVSMLVSVPLFVLAILQHEFIPFLAVLFVLEIALFSCLSPLDAAVVNFVRPELRATAMAVNVFMIHFLGDGISRALMGEISDSTGLVYAMMMCPIVLVVAGLFWWFGLMHYWRPLRWPEGAFPLPRFQAHRGFWFDGRANENSIEAFCLAKKLGAEMIELDTHLSLDQVPIVFHDIDLQRMLGRPQQVFEMSADQLKLEASIDTLRSVLLNPDVTHFVNIELKTARIWGGDFEARVVSVVNECGAASRVLFSSFNPFALRRLSRLATEIPRALLATEQSHRLNRFYFKKMWFAYLARPHLIHLEHTMINASRMTGWKFRNIPVVAWTVNERERILELERLGVRSIISDRFVSEATFKS